MCFSIPYKVIKIDKNTALIEGGYTVRIGKELTANVGDYLQIQGKMAVGVLSSSEGLKIRKLIKSLNN